MNKKIDQAQPVQGWLGKTWKSLTQSTRTKLAAAAVLVGIGVSSNRAEAQTTPILNITNDTIGTASVLGRGDVRNANPEYAVIQVLKAQFITDGLGESEATTRANTVANLLNPAIAPARARSRTLAALTTDEGQALATVLSHRPHHTLHTVAVTANITQSDRVRVLRTGSGANRKYEVCIEGAAGASDDDRSVLTCTGAINDPMISVEQQLAAARTVRSLNRALTRNTAHRSRSAPQTPRVVTPTTNTPSVASSAPRATANRTSPATVETTLAPTFAEVPKEMADALVRRLNHTTVIAKNMYFSVASEGGRKALRIEFHDSPGLGRRVAGQALLLPIQIRTNPQFLGQISPPREIVIASGRVIGATSIQEGTLMSPGFQRGTPITYGNPFQPSIFIDTTLNPGETPAAAAQSVVSGLRSQGIGFGVTRLSRWVNEGSRVQAAIGGATLSSSEIASLANNNRHTMQRLENNPAHNLPTGLYSGHGIQPGMTLDTALRMALNNLVRVEVFPNTEGYALYDSTTQPIARARYRVQVTPAFSNSPMVVEPIISTIWGTSNEIARTIATPQRQSAPVTPGVNARQKPSDEVSYLDPTSPQYRTIIGEPDNEMVTPSAIAGMFQAMRATPTPSIVVDSSAYTPAVHNASNGSGAATEFADTRQYIAGLDRHYARTRNEATNTSDFNRGAHIETWASPQEAAVMLAQLEAARPAERTLAAKARTAMSKVLSFFRQNNSQVA